VNIREDDGELLRTDDFEKGLGVLLGDSYFESELYRETEELLDEGVVLERDELGSTIFVGVRR
jgi:hypothetical protein